MWGRGVRAYDSRAIRNTGEKKETTMTYQSDFTLPSELLEQIATQGFDVLPELIRIVINAAMQAERQQYLRAAPYQHTPDRRGHAASSCAIDKQLDKNSGRLEARSDRA